VRIISGKRARGRHLEELNLTLAMGPSCPTLKWYWRGRSTADQWSSLAPQLQPTLSAGGSPRALIVNRFCVIPQITHPLAAKSSHDEGVKA
jgi:hypothetical protein